jgi:hypothetical protein
VTSSRPRAAAPTTGAGVVVEVLQAVPPAVEPSLRDRPVDGHAPDDAGLPRHRVTVGQRRDGPRRTGQALVVAEVGQRHGSGPHQASVAGRSSRPAGEELCSDPVQVGGAGCGGEHRPGLVADVWRAALEPGQEAPADGDRLDGTPGALLGDADRHLGVVRPLARLPGERAASNHLGVVGAGGAELVAGAERVAGGQADQRAGGTVELDRSQPPHSGCGRVSRRPGWR